jgi:DnaK suppressor protein
MNKDPLSESALTPEQLRHLRTKLEQKRDQLRQKSHQLVRSATRSEEAVSSEEGDLANQQVNINEALGLASHEQALLVQVEAALARFDRGTFGISEESGEPIPFERLDAVPWARTGAAEAEREEHARR